MAQSLIQINEKLTVLERMVLRWRLYLMIAIVVAILGLFATFTIPREADPEVIIPIGYAVVPFPGASPEDVEELITDRVEQEFHNIENVDTITSSSALGGASIVVEFVAGTDMDRSMDDLQEAVDRVKTQLPEDANDPIVGKIRINDIPVVTFSLSGPYSDAQLTQYAKMIQRDFEGIAGVSRVDIIGGLIREWRVRLDADAMQARGIGMSEIMAIIQVNNTDIPSGSIEFSGKSFSVKTSGRFQTIEELQQLPIRSISGKVIFLNDIADVADNFQERSTLSRLSEGGKDPQPAISLSIRKQAGGNILRIVHATEKRVVELKKSSLPDNLTLIKTNDNAQFIREDLSTLGINGLQSIIIIVIVLFLVLSWKEAMLSAFAIPLTYLASIAVLKEIGMTLNSLSLFALVLALGLLVDVFIVVAEGFHDFIKAGCSSVESAQRAIQTYKTPLLAATLTTIGAFLPMLLVGDIIGQYMRPLPITITVVLSISFIISMTLLPTFASRLIKHGRRRGSLAGLRNQLIERIKISYDRRMRSIISSPRKRRTIIGGAWVLLFITLSFPTLGILSSELFPAIDYNFMIVNIETPAGNTLETTEKFVRQVEKRLQEIPDIENFVTSIGTSESLAQINPLQIGGVGSSEHLASITVNLVPKEDREQKSFELMDGLREEFRTFKQAKVTVPPFNAGPPVGAPIEVRITGENRDALNATAKNVETLLNDIPGTIDVDDDIQETAGEFVFRTQKERLAAFGLSELQVALTVRAALTGIKVSSLSQGGDDIDIIVSFQDQDVADVTQLKNLLITTPSGYAIPLSMIADISLEPSVASINHDDRKRIVRVLANTQDRLPAEIFREFDQRRGELEIPEGIAIRAGGELEELTQSFTDLFKTMIVSVLIILTILVIQFNSFSQPLIILFSLPLAFIGVIIGLTIFQLPFSFPAFLGIIGLAGIGVNDGIILIDGIITLINKQHMLKLDAIIQAGKDRLQPTFLTTSTTILGVSTLLFVNEMWFGLGIALISGLIFASSLTLVMIPILYNAFGQKEKHRS